MKATRRYQVILYALAIPVALFILMVSLRQLPSSIGRGDFRAYWSTSYLLLDDQSCSNDTRLLEIQNSETGWPRDYPMRTWNPPWLSAWLLPLALLNFELATQIWLLINIALVLMSIVLARRLFLGQNQDKRALWLFTLGVILFPSTIVAILMGQVNILVLAGLTLFLWLYLAGHDAAAGVALSLTLVKPHLIYLALLIILVVILKDRRWKVVLGFGAAILISTAIVLLLRPSFILECLASTGSGNLLSWQTPTLTTILQLSLGWWWLRIIGVLLVPLAIFFWFRYRNSIPFLVIIDLAVIASIITSPFGWSYDFVVLLLPMMHIWSWLFLNRIKRLEMLLILAITFLMYLAYYYQRVQAQNDLYFFWIPLVIAGLYLWTWYRVQEQNSASGDLQ